MINFTVSLVVVAISLSAFAQSESSLNQTAEINSVSVQQELGTAFTAPVGFLSPYIGTTLSPQPGHLELALTGGSGSLSFNTGNFSYLNPFTAGNLQLAYAFRSGIYLGVGLTYAVYTYQFGSESSSARGLDEPQISIGYRADLTESDTMSAQLTYNVGTGSRTSTSYTYSTGPTNYSDSNTSDAKQGGSAITPSLQYENRYFANTKLGARLSYAIVGSLVTDNSSTYSNAYTGRQSTYTSSTTTGGNVTNAMLFAEEKISQSISLGGAVGALLQAGSSTTDSQGNSYSSSSADYGVIGINLPIRLTKNMALIPEADMERSSMGQNGTVIYNGSVTAHMAF